MGVSALCTKAGFPSDKLMPRSDNREHHIYICSFVTDVLLIHLLIIQVCEQSLLQQWVQLNPSDLCGFMAMRTLEVVNTAYLRIDVVSLDIVHPHMSRD